MKNLYTFNDNNSLTIMKVPDDAEVGPFEYKTLEEAKTAAMKSIQNRIDVITRLYNMEHKDLILKMDLIKNF